jgi:hypothetical protein
MTQLKCRACGVWKHLKHFVYRKGRHRQPCKACLEAGKNARSLHPLGRINSSNSNETNMTKIESGTLSRYEGTVTDIVGDHVGLSIDNTGGTQRLSLNLPKCPEGTVVGSRLSVVTGTQHGYLVAGI